MGDVIRRYSVRTGSRGRSTALRFYFDTGSPRTFIKSSAAAGVGGAARLQAPTGFRGLGNGGFHATHSLHLFVRMAGVWVPHFCYVIPDAVLDPGYDILLGHDFMQIYDVSIRPRTREVVIRREALQMALKVRAAGPLRP